jgi:2-keto-3-deoxy-L-rhamnonate aldolase RhmA
MAYERTLAQVATLKSYITADTPGIGLGFDETNGENARLMEQASTETGDVMNLKASELVCAVDGIELIALPAANRDAWQTVLTAAADDGVNPNDPGVKTQVQEIWANSTTTGSALVALRTKASITFSEQLFGVDTVLVKTDIALARAST